MQTANRVMLNTGMLYGKMVISIVIALYSTRLVLNALGAADYGIFNLVAGVIAMLSFLNMAMTLSTQRYLSHNLGGGDARRQKMVFTASVVLHLLLGIGLVLLLEGAGLFLFGHVLNIPAGRLPAANIIFHMMVASAFFTIISVPYDATLNAHENMRLVSLTGIAEAVLKLGIAVYLQYTGFDKLVMFALLSAGVSVGLLLFKRIYCTMHYAESRLRLRQYFNRALAKEMFFYGGWNMFGAMSVVARNQGIAMILNVFFGTIVNAAYGIANQVNAQLSFFSVTLLQALNPQIMKSEGAGDRQRMLRLCMIASKFSFSLLSFFAIPLVIEMPFILQVWLKNVPEYTTAFCRLILVCTMVNQLSVGIQTGVQSAGNIKWYQVTVSTLLMLNLPVAFLLMRAGLPPYAIMITAAVLEAVTCGYRIWAGRRLIGLPVAAFLSQVVARVTGCALLSACIALLPSLAMPPGWPRLLLTCCVSTAALVASLRLIALTPYETGKLNDVLVKTLSRVSPRLAALKKAA
jgi:O-antigen/teichoic acid export membrane protein